MGIEDPHAQDSRPRRLKTTRWAAVASVYCAGLVCGAYIGKVPPALPPLRADLGLTLVETGLIATMLNVMGGIGGLLVGILCDRFGHKRLGLTGLAVMALGGFLGAAAEGYLPLLASRFLEGAGFILFTVSGTALIAAACADARDRAKALSLWSSYMPTGGSIALLSAPLLLAAHGWRSLWVVFAFAAVASFVLVARNVPAPPFGGVSSLRLAAESFSQRGMVALSLLFTCYVAQWASVMVWLPTFAVDERGASHGAAGLLTALFVLANIPGNLGGGWLLARGVKRGTLVLAACAISALCSIGMLTAALPDAARFFLVLAFSTCAGVIPAAVFSGIPVHAKTPQHIASGNGLIMQASQAGQFVGPIALAWLASRGGGWGATLGAMLSFAAGAALCGLALRHIERDRMGR